MIHIEDFNNEVLSTVEDKTAELIRNAVTSGNNAELYFWCALYASLGMAINRNNLNVEEKE